MTRILDFNRLAYPADVVAGDRLEARIDLSTITGFREASLSLGCVTEDIGLREVLDPHEPVASLAEALGSLGLTHLVGGSGGG